MVQAVDTRFFGAFWAMQAHAGALDMAVMKPDVSYFSATPLVLASRASTLAMAQAKLVRVALAPVESRLEPQARNSACSRL